MPCLKLFTSLSKDKIPASFVSKIIPVLSQTVKKPENNFVVVVSTDCTVVYGDVPAGTPGAVASLESIGHLGLEENKIITKSITEVVHKELGIAPEHFMLTFYDLRAQDVAKFGITMA